MTLKRALEGMTRDRVHDAALRDVLALARRHAGEWIDGSRLSAVIEEHGCRCSSMLEALVAAFVLDFDGDASRYRMRADRFLFLEIDGFMRAAGGQSDLLQANVARFRQKKYGAR
ncbi:MAG: hypothetical protein IBX62_07390 [Coriobacteriia bacterium]|nr:hypothetical protein [Coriobacteriia bacterium]